MRLPEAALGSVCGFVTLLPILLPFFLGVPAPTAEHCWMAEPYVDGEALFGYPLMEINDNFGLLFALYVLANAVSSLGVLMSGRISIKLSRTILLVCVSLSHHGHPLPADPHSTRAVRICATVDRGL